MNQFKTIAASCLAHGLISDSDICAHLGWNAFTLGDYFAGKVMLDDEETAMVEALAVELSTDMEKLAREASPELLYVSLRRNILLTMQNPTVGESAPQCIIQLCKRYTSNFRCMATDKVYTITFHLLGATLTAKKDIDGLCSVSINGAKFYNAKVLPLCVPENANWGWEAVEPLTEKAARELELSIQRDMGVPTKLILGDLYQ